jgi:glutamate-1-semialdehyde 2,1-aminomutase
MTGFMETAITTATAYGLGAMGLVVSAAGLKARLELSKAKHRSLAGHPRTARFVASLVPFYQYDEARFFKADAAPDDVVARRRADFARLAELCRQRYADTSRLTAKATEVISDLQFTEAYRVPFQFSRHVRRH